MEWGPGLPWAVWSTIDLNVDESRSHNVARAIDNLVWASPLPVKEVLWVCYLPLSHPNVFLQQTTTNWEQATLVASDGRAFHPRKPLVQRASEWACGAGAHLEVLRILIQATT